MTVTGTLLQAHFCKPSRDGLAQALHVVHGSIALGSHCTISSIICVKHASLAVQTAVQKTCRLPRLNHSCAWSRPILGFNLVVQATSCGFVPTKNHNSLFA